MKITNRKKYIVGLISIIAIGVIIQPLYVSAKNDKNNNTTINVTKGTLDKPATVNTGPTDEEFIVAWDPFVDFIQMRQEMNNILNNSFNSYVSHQGPPDMFIAQQFSPACDLQKKDGNYVINMDLPGMDKSNINVEVSGRTLSISGKREKIIEEKEGNRIIRSERSLGEFKRAIELPTPVIQDKITAEYKNGVLTVTLPPAEPTIKSAKITVK